MQLIDIVVVLVIIILTIATFSLGKENKELKNSITSQPELVQIINSNKDPSAIESIEIKALQDEIKTKNEIIRMDNVIFTKHARELELYGDFIIAILRGEDREERLLRKDTLEAGAKMTEIRKEIEELIKTRKAL